MSGPNERALRMLTTALEMEEKGRDFYQMASASCDNELGREIFDTLLKDEIVHAERIKAIYSQLEGDRKWSDDWLTYKVGHEDLKPFFRGLAAKLGTEITASTNDLDALGVGIELEQKSIDYYGENLAAATDPQEKRFLARMVEEEKGHRAVLSDMRSYLSDPAAYFAEHERSGLDGA